MVNSFCVGTVASLGLANVGKSSVISGLTAALPAHGDEDGVIPLRLAIVRLSNHMQNGAIWQRVAGAAVNHRLKDLRNVLHILDAPDQLIDRCLRQAFDVNTLPRLVTPKIQ